MKSKYLFDKNNKIICNNSITSDYIIKDIELRINHDKNIIKPLERKKFNCVYRKYKNENFKEYLLIFFSSRDVKLGGLNRMFKFEGNFLLFCDYENKWYQNINNIIEYIKIHINIINAKNIILMGESMGGYGALYLSTIINNSICFAFCPQTCNFYKGGWDILPNHVKDIKQLINLSKNNSSRYIFTGRNDKDIFYTKHLQNTNHTIILFVDFEYLPINEHYDHLLFKVINTNKFYEIIYNHFMDLLNRINFDLTIAKIGFYNEYNLDDTKLYYPILFKNKNKVKLTMMRKL
jgi:hypothetical protein